MRLVPIEIVPTLFQFGNVENVLDIWIYVIHKYSFYSILDIFTTFEYRIEEQELLGINFNTTHLYQFLIVGRCILFSDSYYLLFFRFISTREYRLEDCEIQIAKNRSQITQKANERKTKNTAYMTYAKDKQLCNIEELSKELANEDC